MCAYESMFYGVNIYIIKEHKAGVVANAVSQSYERQADAKADATSIRLKATSTRLDCTFVRHILKRVSRKDIKGNFISKILLRSFIVISVSFCRA